MGNEGVGVPNKPITNASQAVEFLIQKCKEKKEVYVAIMDLIFKNRIKELPNFLKNIYPNCNEAKLLKNFYNNINALVDNCIFKETNEIDKRLFASIYGAFLGDAMGAYCEFSQANLNNCLSIFNGQSIFGKQAGTVTDDSEMAMSMAYGIMDNPDTEHINPSYNYYYYGWWYRSGPADIGNTTRNALRIFDPGYVPSKLNFNEKIYKIIKNHNEGSKANGFLMRFSPFLVWFYLNNESDINSIFKPNGELDNVKLNNLYVKARDESFKDNICTHTNKELCVASAVFTIAGIFAINGKGSSEIIKILSKLLSCQNFANPTPDEKNVGGIVYYCLKNYNMNENGKASGNNNKISAIQRFTGNESVYDRMGYYGHAFKLTLYYLINWNCYNNQPNKTAYRSIMEEIMNFGGDTDTNAAIVGAVLGPLVGFDNIGEADLKTMLKAFDKDRIVYSPAMMYFYVKLMRQNQLKGTHRKEMFFLRMIMHLLFEDVKENPSLFENIKNWQ